MTGVLVRQLAHDVGQKDSAFNHKGFTGIVPAIIVINNCSHVTHDIQCSHVTNNIQFSHVTHDIQRSHGTHNIQCSHLTHGIQRSHVTRDILCSHVTHNIQCSHVTHNFHSDWEACNVLCSECCNVLISTQNHTIPLSPWTKLLKQICHQSTPPPPHLPLHPPLLLTCLY